MKKIFTIVSALAVLISFASCQKENGKDGPGEEEKIIELAVPEGLALSEFGDESIKMTWNPVDKAEYYTYKIIAKIVRNEQARDSVVLMGKTVNTYKTIVKLDSICVKNGYNYWFSVSAGAGKLSHSEYSSYVRCEPGGLTPLVPDGVKVAGYTDNGLTFEWNPAEEADYYTYELSNPKGEVIKAGDTQNTSVTIDGLKKGRYYYLSVSGVNPNKQSAFSTRVEGLTFGTYIPALTFNASFAEDCFSFVEGTELTITDGTKTAGYVVKTSGKTTTLELTTEEEVQYDQPKYTALMPEALSAGEAVSGLVVMAEDGTYAGVPCWAETSGTDMVFHSFYSEISLNVSSAKSADIDKVILRASKALSGKVKSVTTGSNPSIEFESSDAGMELVLPQTMKVNSTPQTLKMLVPIGTHENMCAIFQEEGSVISGKLTGVSKVMEADKPSSDIEFMIVEKVEYQSVCAKRNKAATDPETIILNSVVGYATIKTGTVDDYEFGFLKTPYMDHNWNTAEFVAGEKLDQSGSTFVFKTSLDSIGTAYLRPCVKPKGLPNIAASVGTECFCFDLDFENPNLIAPANAAQSALTGVAAYGNSFPTTMVAIKAGEKIIQHLYSVNTFPFSAGTNSQKYNQKYGIWWDQTNGVCGTYKMRWIIYTSKLLSKYRVTYIYWLATAAKKYFVGNSSSPGTQFGADANRTENETNAPSGITCTKNIYLGSDSNSEMSKRIFLFFVNDSF